MQWEHAKAARVAETPIGLAQPKDGRDVAQAGQEDQHGALLVSVVNVAKQVEDQVVVDHMLIEAAKHVAYALAILGVACVRVLWVDTPARLLPLLRDRPVVHGERVLVPLARVAQPARRVGREYVPRQLECMLEIVLIDGEGTPF